jgi:hypothetical protein
MQTLAQFAHLQAVTAYAFKSFTALPALLESAANVKILPEACFVRRTLAQLLSFPDQIQHKPSSFLEDSNLLILPAKGVHKLRNAFAPFLSKP